VEEISVGGQEEVELVTVTAQFEFTEPASAEAAATTAISRDPIIGFLLFSCGLDWGRVGEGDCRLDRSGVEGRSRRLGKREEGRQGEGEEECCCSSVVALAVITSILAVSGVI